MIAVALPDIIDDFDRASAPRLARHRRTCLALAASAGRREARRPRWPPGLSSAAWRSFGLASLGAALAPSLAFLIGFRTLQAVSGALVFPNGAGLIRELVPAERRGGAFGIGGGSIALAAALGPLSAGRS